MRCGRNAACDTPEKANRSVTMLLGITITTFAWGGEANQKSVMQNGITPQGGSTAPHYERNDNQVDYNHPNGAERTPRGAKSYENLPFAKS